MYEIYLAGAAAAFTVDCLVYPLDTLKTRYQSQDFVQTFASSKSSPNKKVFRGLYQGIGSVILATLPAAGIFFATYESMKRTITVTFPGGPQPLVHSIASGIAEMASCVVLAPAEVIKQNAQMLSRNTGPNTSRHSTSLAALRQRLFTGYSALVARNLPFTAIQFPIFEYVRERVWETRGRGSASSGKALVETAIITGLSAASAGAFAAWITTPSDVVKTRMMLRAGEKQPDVKTGGAGAKPVKGSMAVAREVYQTTGIRGLFRGGLFRSAWTALGSGLYLGTYEMSKVWLTAGEEESAF
ncbi:mitochondrial S-adenosylmethionine transporter [Plectosphaerella plurivora]|uniref:Mitochondrial S-adenosylmethionine transporter n=1 Tax=Plectosphaerella plurivora TaxID=936078 RepID=A0A9P8VLT8_9PEZI|nr:mitochondrial S-adenosylmethionine transporter [Plectosphaerella plurivora]